MDEDDPCRPQDTDYQATIYKRIKDRWYKLIPREAQAGQKGEVSVHFQIGRDGQIHDIETPHRSVPDSMVTAVLQALNLSSPLPEPHFADPKCEQVGATIRFFYNMCPDEGEDWIGSD